MTKDLPDICTCDVGDKQKLAVFREKRAEWCEAIIGNDAHSIKNQILSILWEDAIVRTVNEARRLFVEAPHKDKGFNSDLIGLLDRGFVVRQIMAIRRLTDPGFHDPERAVISLTSVLDDMERNLALLTREHYICYDGTPFEHCSEGVNHVDYFHWRARQQYFDRLSGVSEKHRTRRDRVDEHLFSKLRKKLSACDDFRAYANKFIAHAAAPSKKRDEIKEERQITLNKFDEAYQAIVQVSSLLGVAILYEHGLGQVPTPQYDHLENLDKPMILKNESASLSDFWHRRVREVESWGANIWPN